MRNFLVYLIVFFCAFVTTAQSKSFKQTLDSIQKLRAYTFDENLSPEKRLEYALKSSELAHKTKVDTTILLSDRRVGFQYFYYLEDHPKIFEWSHRNLKLAKKLNDSLVIAYMYYHLGWHYGNQNTSNDSIYYYYKKSNDILHKIKKFNEEVELLLHLASVHEGYKDYITAENYTIKAIELNKTFPESKNQLNQLYRAYIELGLILSNTKQFGKTLKYYNKALSINKKLKRTANYYTNNLYTTIYISETLKKQKKYNKSIDIYNELLEDEKLYERDAITYAAVLNNLAHVKLLNKDSDYNNIKSLFKRAYHISDSLNAPYEISSVGNDFSGFYLSLNQKDSALPYLNRSLKLAKQIKENEEVLRSLKLLSEATDGEAGKQYLYEYIKLNDSLIANERTARNKFARIQFETDEIIGQRDKATKERSLLFGTSIALVAMLMLVFLAFYQRSKNKQLRFDQVQQQANENIYSLMLKQQSTLEQGRTEERYRISEELHDGILSKLFGTRMGLGLLSKSISTSDNNLDKYNSFIDNMQAIETDIRNVSHALKDESLTTAVDFVAIIEHYIKDICALHHLEYTLYANPEINWTSVNDNIKVNLYRVLQESLQNIIKHAKADTVDVNFYLINNQLQLSVKDNGIGFNTTQLYKGIGLKNIKSRMLKLSGSFSVSANPDKGAIINVSVPI